MSTDNECSAVARVGAESLRQTKDGLRKERQNTSSSLLQHSKSRAGFRGRPTPRQMPSRHPESGMHPRPTKNETPTLVPNLNRGMNAGMDRVDVNAHLDGTGKRHGTSQGLTKVIGRDHGTSQAHLETQEGKTHGKTTNSPWSNQPKESTKEFAKIPS